MIHVNNPQNTTQEYHYDQMKTNLKWMFCFVLIFLFPALIAFIYIKTALFISFLYGSIGIVLLYLDERFKLDYNSLVFGRYATFFRTLFVY